jgi:hypothetical protein
VFKAGTYQTECGKVAVIMRDGNEYGALGTVKGIGFVGYDPDGKCVNEDGAALGLNLILSTHKPHTGRLAEISEQNNQEYQERKKTLTYRG